MNLHQEGMDISITVFNRYQLVDETLSIVLEREANRNDRTKKELKEFSNSVAPLLLAVTDWHKLQSYYIGTNEVLLATDVYSLLLDANSAGYRLIEIRTKAGERVAKELKQAVNRYTAGANGSQARLMPPDTPATSIH